MIEPQVLDPAEPPRLLDAEDVARVLGKHPRTVLILAQRGELASIRLGRRTIRFHPDDVAAFIDAHRSRVAP